MKNILDKSLQTIKGLQLNVELPKRKVFDTPRLLQADAYTIGSDKFQSKEDKEDSRGKV